MTGAEPVVAADAPVEAAAPGRPSLIPLGGAAAVCDGDTCTF